MKKLIKFLLIIGVCYIFFGFDTIKEKKVVNVRYEPVLEFDNKLTLNYIKDSSQIELIVNNIHLKVKKVKIKYFYKNTWNIETTTINDRDFQVLHNNQFNRLYLYYRINSLNYLKNKIKLNVKQKELLIDKSVEEIKFQLNIQQSKVTFNNQYKDTIFTLESNTIKLR